MGDWPIPMLLEARSLSKHFPAVKALDGVDLEFADGEVHGIIGENGAGKSTLMRLLAGIYAPTSGEILIDGKPVHLRSPHDAIQRGISMIHQELNLVDELSVAENILLGREPRKMGMLDRAKMREVASAALKRVAAPFGPSAKVGDLSIAGKQLVEIAKAVSLDAKLLIMDEPTAVLSEREAKTLFELIRQLKSEGVTVIYISHLLPEVVAICDRITVMRDGRWIATLPAESVTPDRLAALMVGRELEDVFPAKLSPVTDTLEEKAAAPVLSIEEFSLDRKVPPLSFSVAKGEILGLAGLVGSGRTELAEAILGLRPRATGRIVKNGRTLNIHSPAQAMKAGIAYVSEDRKGAGLVLPMDVRENVTLANLRAYTKPFLSRKAVRGATEKWIEKLGIRVGDAGSEVGTLSGGNQQKVAVAKWLDTKPEVLILDEPTRGIDVGAKREMYALIHDLAAEGLACIVISSEMTELIGLCHRILVLRNGGIAGELTGEDMTEENIMTLAAGVTEAAA